MIYWTAKKFAVFVMWDDITKMTDRHIYETNIL